MSSWPRAVSPEPCVPGIPPAAGAQVEFAPPAGPPPLPPYKRVRVQFAPPPASKFPPPVPPPAPPPPPIAHPYPYKYMVHNPADCTAQFFAFAHQQQAAAAAQQQHAQNEAMVAQRVPPPPPPPPPPVVGHLYPHPVCNPVDTAAQYYASYFTQQQQQQQHAHNAAMMATIGLPTIPQPAFSRAHPYLMMHNPGAVNDPAAQYYAYACALWHQSAVEAQQQVHAHYQAHRAAAMVRHEEHQAAVMAQGNEDAHYRAYRAAAVEQDVQHSAYTSALQRIVIRFVGELEK